MRQQNDGLAWAPSIAKGFDPRRSLLLLIKPLLRIRVEKKGTSERSTHPRRSSIPHSSPR